MEKLLTVLNVEEARGRIVEVLEAKRTAVEAVALGEAAGRVTAEDIKAPEKLPPFPRSTMDGFAVRSADTFGASESMPALLYLKGEVFMGQEPPGGIGPGEAMVIPTGGILPPGSDSVVMLEYCDLMGGEVAVYRPAAPYENILRAGEDFQEKDLLFPPGHRLRPQDVGILAALGVQKVKAYAKPRVHIFSTGDEVVDYREEAGPAQIRDVNGPMLAAQVQECGGEPCYGGIIPDRRQDLHEQVLSSLRGADLILVSGGSSVGSRDVTMQVIDDLPEGGILFHGVSMRPGKPMIFGMGGGIPVFGLSGNPVSAKFSFILFVVPVLRLLQGLSPLPKYKPYLEACLSTNFSSPGGREDYVRAALYEETSAEGEKTLWARPVFGGPGLLRTAVRADGYFVIHRDAEGLPAGAKVNVYLFSAGG